MTISTIFYIALALLVALGFAFFQYLFRKKDKRRKDYIFFALRAISIFLLLLLLINPKITSTEYEAVKPNLVILADNSQSVTYLEEEGNLQEISRSLSENDEILKHFEVSHISFSNGISIENDSLDFTGKQTNIYNALSETQDIFSEKPSAIVLLTDGNQSLGRDFRYFKTKDQASVFPVVIGDTTTYRDLSIERINSNRYAFLNNRFPVEVFLNYTGNEAVETSFRIRSGSDIVFTKNLQFSKDSKSQVVRTELPANSLGVKTYRAEIGPLADEKNTVNNQQNFAVEVIDERTSVLILSDLSHPDLGAIKKSIESNQQRTSDIKYLNKEKIQLSDYQLVILYQINRRFNSVFTEIRDKNFNYLIVTGSQTDWNYLNSLGLGYSRNATSQPQEIFPVYNPTFSSFQFEDIDFEDFPPLVDKFGPLEFDKNKFGVMLYQELQGVKTGDPLMGVSQNSPKSGFLFGENLWRWRAKSYLDNKSFQEFDDFFGKLIQNLSSKRSRDRLTVDNENFYYANQDVIITAQYFDENYQFDAGANLKINIINKDNPESFNSDLVLKNNFYQFDAGNLPAGNYAFTIEVQNRNISRSGSFEVIDYNTEQQFVSANLEGLLSFSENNQANLTFPDRMDELVTNLLNNDKFRPVQKSREKSLPLIDWYYLLFILIIILAAEWFYRKYLGLI
ncbi:VWA domain-containing protein [Gramella jeungdoensis]|uniref:VWA domain-containing protein n=1 Tax=Gramella jeungdoensis TaxID=708091 RepID=A0ABT0Z2K9_9FLAO|nr:vWA domain-containing protein [Gramella jeungdoensis]MCM8569972.1 VWA domain-containing protein [Gramella jeungdoensis]